MNFPADEVLIDHLVSLQVVCERAVRVSAGHTLETLAANELLQLALAMAVAQIGEVSGRLIKKWPAFCEDHPEIELVRANAMRHRLIHGYENTDVATLWDTVKVSVPAMLEAVGLLLSISDAHEP